MTIHEHGFCTIREHVGIEKVIGKLGMGERLMPDPELGQDVAFLAHVIEAQKDQLLAGERHQVTLKEISELPCWCPGAGVGGKCLSCVAKKAIEETPALPAGKSERQKMADKICELSNKEWWLESMFDRAQVVGFKQALKDALTEAVHKILE